MNNEETKSADEAAGRALREDREAKAAMDAMRQTAGRWAIIVGDLAAGLKRLSDQGNTAHLERVKDTLNSIPSQEELDKFFLGFLNERRKSENALKYLDDLNKSS